MNRGKASEIKIRANGWAQAQNGVNWDFFYFTIEMLLAEENIFRMYEKVNPWTPIRLTESHVLSSKICGVIESLGELI